MRKDVILLDEDSLKGDDFYFGISKVEKHYPLHFHDFYEIELVIEGKGKQIINGNTYEINNSTLYLYHINDYHEIFADEPLLIYNIAFNRVCIDESTISDIFDYDNEIVISLTPHRLAQITEMMKLIQDVYESDRTNKRSILSHLLNAMLLIAIGSEQKKQISNPDASFNSINSVLRYIHENFARSPSLDEISAFSGYQKNYFCDLFKKKTSMTYVEYLTAYKINYSKKLLKVTSKTIKEIAQECGFNSANNFIRDFKKKNNITPKQYRKQYANY